MRATHLAVPIALVFAVVWMTPAQAAEAARCLSRDQQRAAIAEGKAVPLASALQTLRRKVPGELVRARLCQEGDRMVYKLILLARDGKVKRAVIDAANGALVGELDHGGE
jgi:uncharacterized membrane protein YkoI